jgi:acetyl-CoA carboxylase biotin carboxyl carrier protein
MDLRKLKTLIDLVSESNISELEIPEAEGKVRIVKSEGPSAGVVYTAQPVRNNAGYQQHEGGGAAQSPHVIENTPGTESGGAIDSGAPGQSTGSQAASAVTGHVAKSPMVGTFYRSSTPGGKPFVEVGSVVKQGETICIIEAMKILNEIEADHSGTVTQILVNDGQAVEYGQSIFVIE